MSAQEEETSSMKKLLVIIDEVDSLSMSDILKAARGDQKSLEGVQQYFGNIFLIDIRKNLPFFVSLLNIVFRRTKPVVVFSVDDDSLLFEDLTPSHP